MTVGERVKKIVDDRGIKYVAIANATNIPIDTISKTFNGKRKMLGDELISICRFLNIELDDLIAGSDIPAI